MSGISKTKRLAIASELANLGLVKSSLQYRRTYARLYRKQARKRPDNKKKEAANWARYYKKKMASSKEWNKARIAKWRKQNPKAWKIIMNRAIQNGSHKRFYEKHRARLSKEKAAYARRKNPSIGLKAAIDSFSRSGDWEALERELKQALILST